MTMIPKNSYLFIFIICLSITFCFTTCKKYQEDKFISLKQPEKRVIGNWKIIQYNFNGNNIIDELNIKLNNFDIKDLTLVVVGKKGKEEGYCVFTPYFNSGIHDFPIDKSDRSKFHFDYYKGNIGFGDSLQKMIFLTPLSLVGANYANWDIRNLYKNKMHLQLKTDSGNYDIYFEK